MNIVDHEMAYEGANRLLQLIKGYGWSKADIAMQKLIVADFKSALEQAKQRDKEIWG